MGDFIIEYFKGADGEILLIRVNGVDDLIKLKEIFYNLANNIINEFSIKQIENIQFININDVVMTNDSTYIYTKKKNNIIYWEQPETDWYNCEGLIEGAKIKRGGHQYFSDSENGITIEISENETFR